ncbi:hypothetical protein ACYULU_08390 [Breznakiellaceae bacterium SP9]
MENPVRSPATFRSSLNNDPVTPLSNPDYDTLLILIMPLSNPDYGTLLILIIPLSNPGYGTLLIPIMVRS